MVPPGTSFWECAAKAFVSRILLVSFVNAVAVSGSPCQHKPPSSREFTRGALLESSSHTATRRSFDQPLRIYLSYDSSISSLPDSTLSIIKDQVLSPAVSFWRSTLSVPSTSSSVKLFQSCKEDRLAYYGNDLQPYCALGCNTVTMCGEVAVPASHLAACRSAASRNGPSATDDSAYGGIPDTDFILYVSSLTTDRCSGPAVAYAAYCQLEVVLDRPVAGYVNICPKEFSLDLSKQVEMLASVVKHEILHAIGFSLGLFAFYRDSSGQPLTPRGPGNLPPEGSDGMYQYSNRVAKVVQRRNWLQKGGIKTWSVTMLVTPKVQLEARRQFNCSTLEGAELENQGDAGTQLTHWEKRVFENELMTGIYTTLPVVSRLTLALLEDTGWYTANYDMAEPLDWGANLGCDFAQNSCYYWMLTRQSRNESIHPFCNRAPRVTATVGTQTGIATVTECDVSRHSKTMCNLQLYATPLPPAYQYFENGSLGGYVELADYCPYVQVFNYKLNDVAVRDSRCIVTANQPGDSVNYAAETYSSVSRCFEQQGSFSVRRCLAGGSISVALTYGSGCYEYECSTVTGLTISVLGTKYRCYYAGQTLNVSAVSSSKLLHRGTIVCPPCSSICLQEQHIACPPDQMPPSSADADASEMCRAVSSAPWPSTGQLSSTNSLLAVAAVAAIGAVVLAAS